MQHCVDFVLKPLVSGMHLALLSVGVVLPIAMLSPVLAEESIPRSEGSIVQDRSESTLATVTVRAKNDKKTYTGKKATTATKLNLSIKETPQSVSVLTRKLIEDQGATNLGELLQQTTGVVLTGDNTERTNFSIRGFSAGEGSLTSTLQQDGIATTMSTVTMSKPDMAMYESVEVLRGAAGLMQGSGEPAGAINLIRKKPTANFQGNAAISYGSWNTVRGEFDVSGKLNRDGTVRGRFVAAYQDADSFMKGVTRDSSLLYGIVSADLTASTLLNIGVTNQQEHAVPVNSLPRYADGSDIGLNRDNCGCSAWTFWNKENSNVFIDLIQQFENGWSVKGTYSKSWNNMDMTFTTLTGALDPKTKQPNAKIGPFLYDYAYRYKQQVDVWDIFAKGPFQLFNREHELVVGATAQQSDTPGQWTDYYKVGLADLFTHTPYTQAYIDPRYFNDGGNSYDHKKQYGAYLTARFNITDPFNLIVGARVSKFDFNSEYKSNVTGQFVPSRATSYQKSNILTPYIGLTYALNDTYSVYASYADTFVVQNVKDVSGGLLDPIVGGAYEAGIKGAFNRDAVIATLAVFRTDQVNRSIDDLSSPNPCPGTAAGYCKVAAGKVISEGIEAEIRGEVTSNLNISAGYTYNTTEYAKDPVNSGRVFNENTPEHIARLFATYKLPNQLTLGGGVNYQSEWSVGRYGATPAKQPAYALVNLMASYPINDTLTVAFNASNVFDKKYYSYITTTSNRYGDPVNAKLTLRAKF